MSSGKKIRVASGAGGWDITGKSLVLKTRDIVEALEHAQDLDDRGTDVVVYKQRGDPEHYFVYAGSPRERGDP
jgi:hypothetical protein